MTDKDRPVEEIAEKLLQAYGDELTKSRNTYYDTLEDKSKPDPPVFAEPEHLKISPRRRVSMRRIIILVAALILLLGLALISSEGAEKQAFRFSVNDYEDRTDLGYLGGESGADGKAQAHIEAPDFVLGYIPEGYSLSKKDYNDRVFRCTYANSEGESFSLLACGSQYYNASVFDESLTSEEIMINSHQGLAFYDSQNCIIIWEMGPYTLTLSTNLNVEESLKVARKIFMGT